MVRKILMGLAAVVAVIVITGVVFIVSPPVQYWVLFDPWHAFDRALAPPAPDYNTEAAWLVSPAHPGAASLVPADSGAEDQEANGQVDVFFIHPTTYLSRDGWNARYDEPGGTESRLQNGVVRLQVSAYNGCCRIYAPRYRQATFYSFLGHGESEDAALDLSYQDVLRAFDYYIAHRNQGRPFILAGHSQGSLHGMRLLQDRIAGTPLARQMVAAYLIGYALPVEMNLPGGMGPCHAATDTGCYLSWNSLSAAANPAIWQQNPTIWLDKKYQSIAGRKLTCVNPLTFTLDGTAPAAQNIGGLGYPPDGAPLGQVRKELTSAACTDGVLVVNPPTDDPGLTKDVRNGFYHIHDYNLFYMNLRQNLAVRTAAYMKALASNDRGQQVRTP